MVANTMSPRFTPALLSVRLPTLTPSGNTTLRQHWAHRQRDRKTWTVQLLHALGVNKHWEHRLTTPARRRVRITRYARRSLDADNLAAGCKQLVDALRDVRLIWDDSPAFADLEFVQAACAPGEKPHTTVDVFSVGDVS